MGLERGGRLGACVRDPKIPESSYRHCLLGASKVILAFENKH